MFIGEEYEESVECARQVKTFVSKRKLSKASLTNASQLICKKVLRQKGYLLSILEVDICGPFNSYSNINKRVMVYLISDVLLLYNWCYVHKLFY